MENKHIPILLNEAIESLNIKSDGIYLDLTVGMGGHSSEILKRLKNGLLVGFDKDLFAIEESRKRLSKIGSNFQLIHSDFNNVADELAKLNINAVDGILVDLGISSPQVDNAERGFSYSKDARLDMRMNTNQALDAHFVVNNYSEDELITIFYNYAEVKLAKQVANAIIKNRPINTTLELAEVIKSAYPAKLLSLKNPCKAVFQAIRIEVNNEFSSINSMLVQALNLLKKDSSLAIITFHSLEDSIIKKFFGNLIKSKHPSKMPINEEKKYIVKVYSPSKAEISENNRSRSAKLRVLTKLI
ncbi:16S rRNA (cytosine(1402)-N(4))-methyltransferase RsmH [Mycoplasmopsis agalactiae]|uniref:16S rRNA (cytosine(1402)-N(4))-methyltransferase RsmH n=1 Tax=Mycoplasmopsis agalactiae TaxID=2110 RepID=UPI001F342F65|nr:16S rRNA (cytosine(1402)-N(4))-methyltransferase RsmH [Mycoplasmopsis agalactiae]MCE6056390.1 16S rRNA (cytosine(1402)-N(4))-methyltransferase RsmH [Mycoplasmopsis agalactiae]UUM25166.1 16S rRNA (cytosine(1402)-N(4))-methyltransferase RsmH [Mycoplasmopsis agalactiae]